MKEYLFATDFDQTLSFNDSGHVLSANALSVLVPILEDIVGWEPLAIRETAGVGPDDR